MILAEKDNATYEDLEAYLLQGYRIALGEKRDLSIKVLNDILAYYEGEKVYLKPFVYLMKQYLTKKVRYKEDSEIEQVILLPHELMAVGVGDCKTYTLFGAVMCGLLGFKNILAYLVGYLGSQHYYEHIFNNAEDLAFDLTGKNLFMPRIKDVIHLKKIHF